MSLCIISIVNFNVANNNNNNSFCENNEIDDEVVEDIENMIKLSVVTRVA